MKKISIIFFCFLYISGHAQQGLQPGFNAKEYLETISMFSRMGDTVASWDKTPAPVHFDKIYSSPVVGLKNKWCLWLQKDKQVAVISIRGTVNELPSWLENFYAAMIPAKGSLQLNDSTIFHYQFADNPEAMVHVGWTIGIAFLAPTIIEKIKEQYANGVKEFVIAGHSQGGALAFLLRSYLFYLTQKGELPKDIVYKTYCSAAPKPGNLYYAYDYDFITRNGWAFTVVNAKDWVPETPFSVQRITDFNSVNPFVNVKDVLAKQKMVVRWYLNGVFNKLDRRTTKSQRSLNKYLGSTIYGQVKKVLPQLKEPEYTAGANYMRAGVPIVLIPDEAYMKEHPDDPKKIWEHHMPYAYYALTEKYYGNK